MSHLFGNIITRTFIFKDRLVPFIIFQNKRRGMARLRIYLLLWSLRENIYISSKRKITFVCLHDNWDLHWALMPVPHPLKVLLKQPTNNARQHINGKFPVWVHHKYYNLIDYNHFLCTWDNQLQIPPFRARLVRRDDEWNKKKDKSQLFEWTNVFYGAKQSFWSVFPTIIVNVKNLKNPPCSWISSFL